MVYEPAKPRPNAPSAITLDPLELIDRLVLLVPPPRVHRHRYCGRARVHRPRYHGVLAPHARLRAAVTARANQAVRGVIAISPVPENSDASCEESAAARARSTAVRMWAALLARIYEVFPLVCPQRIADYVHAS